MLCICFISGGLLQQCVVCIIIHRWIWETNSKMVLILSILFLISFYILCKRESKDEGWYSTIAVFGIGCYIYYIGIPLEFVYLVNDPAGDLSGVTYEQWVLIAGMGLVAFWSFSIGYILSGFKPFETCGTLAAVDRLKQKFPNSLIYFMAGCMLVLFLLYRAQLMAVAQYAGSYGTTYKNPVFSLLCCYAYFTLAILAGSILLGDRKNKWRRRLAIFSIIMVALWGIYSKDKDPLLIAALAGSMSLVGKKGGVRYLFVIIGGSCLALFGVLVFSVYRGGGDIGDLLNVLKYFGFRSIDPSGPMLTLYDVIESNEPLRMGGTYVDGLSLLVPKFLWPERPTGLAESFAVTRMNVWSEGIGYAYSLLAESYLNFSVYGAFIQYFILGLVWGLGCKLVKKVLWHFSERVWTAYYCILGYYLLILMHRNETMGLVKNIMFYVFVPVVLTVIVDQAILAIERIRLFSVSHR